MRQIVLAFVFLLVTSCKKNTDTVNPDIKLSQWLITKVEGAATGNKNETIALTVYWPYSSGCDVLYQFEETRQTNIVIIKALGYSASGICTADAGIKTKIYNFSSSKAGTFELRFLNRNNTFITHTIIIN